MEQYELAKRRLYGDIRFCLKHFKPENIYIRLKGSCGGTVKINETLEDKTLDVKKVKEGLSILLDDSEIFLYKLYPEYTKQFLLAYRRDLDKNGRIVMLPTGINPDDSSLPPVKTSFFRIITHDYLMHIFFNGKIPLKFHSWRYENWKVWCVDRDLVLKK